MLKDNLINYIKDVMENCNNLEDILYKVTAKALAQKFGVKRNTVSHYLNQAVGNTLIKINTRPVYFLYRKFFEKECFSLSKCIYNSINELLAEIEDHRKNDINLITENNKSDILHCMIGYNGSLKKAVEQIKASVFYPKSSLPIFLYGATGVGKSYIAKLIYQFSVENGVLPENAPYITFNCAQYANNPELLASSLFGYVKGSFTGAYKTTKGFLEAADGGMLFLDEIHRLNSEGQEKLFIFLDQGIFHRMGENDTWHKANVRIVMATTEDLCSNFLETFLRRIPIFINIPSLSERPYNERLQFVYYFFLNESKVLNRNILISGNVLDILVNHEYKGNIGAIKNIIKYVCATAYAKNKDSKEISLHLNDLPYEVLKDVAELDKVKIKKNTSAIITPDSKLEDIVQAKADGYKCYSKLFSDLNLIFGEYKSQRIKKVQFEQKCFYIINDMFDYLIYKHYPDNENSMMKYIINSVSEALRYVEYNYNIRFEGNSLYAIAVYFFYLNVNYEEHKIEENVDDSKDLLLYIKRNYRNETQVVNQILDILSSKMDIVSREKDIIPLSLYLKGIYTKSSNNRVKAIILAHGYATASSISSVANRFLEENIFYAVDMPINRDADDTIKWIIDYIRYNDISNGLILLVDMDSLSNLYISLKQFLKVPVAIINNISTQMVINAGIMIKKDFHLESIVKKLKESNQTEYRIIYPQRNKQKALLTCCLTGIGTAEQIKVLLKDSIPEDLNIKIISYDYDHLKNDILEEDIFEGYKIIGVIGTIDPKFKQIPFIPLEDLVSGKAEEKIFEIFSPFANNDQIELMKNSLIRNFSMKRLISSLIILDPDKVLNNIEECLKKYEMLTGEKLTNSKKISAIIHVGCLLERLIRKCPIEQYPDLEKFQQSHKKQIKIIQDAFSDVEKAYSVKFPLSEIGYLYDILTKI